jgi:preprotein translocase subunit SecA
MRWWRWPFGSPGADRGAKSRGPGVERIREVQATLASEPDDALRGRAATLKQRAGNGEPAGALAPELFAIGAIAAERVLGLAPFDVQLAGALVMAGGAIAEMQTGEGKTLAAVFPAALHALSGQGVHVMTANDYLARRDAAWMRPLYEFLGLSAGALGQELDVGARQAAYTCDITYGTANEFGFDLLRDHLHDDPTRLVQRRFHFALVDEADSILIDEARIPLVIAGGDSEEQPLAVYMAHLVRRLRRGVDYTTDEHGRNVQLTEAGAHHAEHLIGRGSLYIRRNLHLLIALNAALHAHALLRHDVDYVVKGGRIRLVDEFKGRIAQDRRWPDGIQAALEAKEGLPVRRGGRVLASITVQNLMGLYPRVAGMTGTAATQAEEFKNVYSLEVVVIPTNRPMRRRDHPDVVFSHRAAKERALVKEIARLHAAGRPVLVGTASVDESERLGAMLDQAEVPHQVLNARNDEQEAAIVAQAGLPGAVTISTNMAGRGVDILLGGNPPERYDEVVAAGGLYVIGTNRHEARRIDNQLRGRAGRQGDPGESRFFISFEDDLIRRFGLLELLPERFRSLRQEDPVDDAKVAGEVARAQRIIESQNLEIRRMLWKYEQLVEAQRRIIHARRRAVLLGEAESLVAEEAPELWTAVVERAGLEAARGAERAITLAKIDELWSDYLAQITEIRDGIHWQSFAGKDPVNAFRSTIIDLFETLIDTVEREIVEAFEKASITREGADLKAAGLLETGATWTYQSTDQLYGPLSERWMKAMRPMMMKMMRGGG